MKGFRVSGFISMAGTSICHPDKSVPLKRLWGFCSELTQEKNNTPSKRIINLVFIQMDFNLLKAIVK
jgi:hypothetical protein